MRHRIRTPIRTDIPRRKRSDESEMEVGDELTRCRKNKLNTKRRQGTKKYNKKLNNCQNNQYINGKSK
jgi:hypothetical protein